MYKRLTLKADYLSDGVVVTAKAGASGVININALNTDIENSYVNYPYS